MKIGIDCRLWGQTGVGRYIRNLVSELQKIDEDNEYVLFIRSRDYEVIRNLLAGKAGKELGISKNWKIVIADIRWHSIEEQVRFPMILNKEELDLMHFPYFSAPAFYKKPYVITIHDLIISHFPTGKASTLPLSLYNLKRLGYKYVVKRAVDKAKKIIVPTETVGKDLIETLGVHEDKIAVTYEGVGYAVSSSKHKASGERKNNTKYLIHNTSYFLYVGNAYPHKNLEKLIRAFSVFRTNINEDVMLILVGKDDYFYKKLEEKIDKENYTNIVFKHNVKDAELYGLYENSIALLSPSLAEGFGLTPVEAISHGSLVAVSDIAVFREVLSTHAFYFDPNSVGDIAKKMNEVYVLDDKKKKEIIDSGLGWVRKYSWEKMAKQTINIYKEVAGSK